MADQSGLKASHGENEQSSGVRVVVFDATRMGCELLSRALEASEYDLRVVDTARAELRNSLFQCTHITSSDAARFTPVEFDRGPG